MKWNLDRDMAFNMGGYDALLERGVGVMDTKR
jgi:hypothetical protein